ncbi:MAG: DUF3179 domain-containing (seleno)protein, partial [Chitinophagaceae bacterium]
LLRLIGKHDRIRTAPNAVCCRNLELLPDNAFCRKPGNKCSKCSLFFIPLYHLYPFVCFDCVIACFIYPLSQHNKEHVFIFSSVAILYGIVFYYATVEFVPGMLFGPLNEKRFSKRHPVFNGFTNDNDKPVLGITVNGESKAYPVEVIGFHHAVEDTVGGQPLVVTYCTLCHTGRVFALLPNHTKPAFNVIGLEHNNAILEDIATKSWWQQATGKAIAGRMKGKSLQEIPSEQMSLSAWLRDRPNTLVLQRDPQLTPWYEELGGSDRLHDKGMLDQRSADAWQAKSWVVGIDEPNFSKAYDWNEIVVKQVINDSLPALPVLLVLEPDRKSYHVWKREVSDKILSFIMQNNTLTDTTTNSTWNFDGVCIAGPLQGQKLQPVQASQEFWHSWLRFHPETVRHSM